MRNRGTFITAMACGLIALGVVGRVAPHAPNFTPLAGVALFASFLLGRRAAVLVTLATMVFSDLWIGGYTWGVMAGVYGGLLLPAVWGRELRARLTPANWCLTTLTGSLVFFALSNGAVWAFTGMYAPTWQGLVRCYVQALPFLRHTVAGDLFWSAALFGSYLAIRSLSYRAQLSKPRVALAVD